MRKLTLTTVFIIFSLLLLNVSLGIAEPADKLPESPFDLPEDVPDKVQLAEFEFWNCDIYITQLPDRLSPYLLDDLVSATKKNITSELETAYSSDPKIAEGVEVDPDSGCPKEISFDNIKGIPRFLARLSVTTNSICMYSSFLGHANAMASIQCLKAKKTKAE